jgi:hypothetical protein
MTPHVGIFLPPVAVPTGARDGSVASLGSLAAGAPGLLGCAVVAGSFDPVAYNRAGWDREVENDNEWTRPAGREVNAGHVPGCGRSS